MRMKVIGHLAGAMGGIPVSRAQDLQKKGKGVIFLEDRMSPLVISGRDTDFLKHIQVGAVIVLPGEAASSAEVASVDSDIQLTLKREFRGLKALELLSADEGTKYTIAPKIDQSAVYNEVFKRLNEGGCVGIFPEGGSHDRTELLPLKAGVAIMALGALMNNPECNLRIVPCGMNYFHAHRFRSRAVIEFGSPLEVPRRLVDMYAKSETKREATKELLDMIYDSLAAVTVQVADYETLMVIQAGRRLYKPAHRKLPLQSVVELNRRFITGYNHFKDDARVIKLKEDVLSYNKDLYLMGIKDHQLTNLKLSPIQVLGLLVYRSIKLTLLALGALPGSLLFLPVFFFSKAISKRKAREALAGSSVKIQARDVLATWKLLVAMVFAPLLYVFYAIVGTYVVHRYSIGPPSLRHEWGFWALPTVIMILLPMVTYSALRFGEIGMDIYKSLRPLLVAMTNSEILDDLQDRREALAEELTGLINTLGPKIFPDFDSTRVVAMPDYMVEHPTTTRPRSSSNLSEYKGFDTPSLTQSMSPDSPGAQSPMTESFGLLSSPFISTAPASRRSYSRTHSRQPSHSGGITSVQMSGLRNEDGLSDFSVVTSKIRAEMGERMKRRRSEHFLRTQSKSGSMSSTASTNNTEHLDSDDKPKIL